jgi:bifunctional non-homologous end joining protein LigD
VFDLDPLDDDQDRLRRAALAVRALLAELGCRSWIKTSGSKGYHIAFALDGKADYGNVAHFGHSVGRELVKREPDTFTQEFYKADRGGRILIDTGRNEFGATFAAPYALRPRPGAPVSAPCSWDEIESGAVAPGAFRMRDMAGRIESVGDVWRDMLLNPRSLPEYHV